MRRIGRMSFGIFAFLLCCVGAASSAYAQTGGCCLNGGVCISVTQAGCASAFPPGAYQGDGSACPGLCGQQGACCFTDGSCDELFYGPCNTGDGTFQGSATTCSPNLCPPPAPVPTQINHQGVVSVNGQRFSGNGSFYFAIIDPDTGNAVWTNDATNIGTAIRPNQAVTIACANGLYDVRLGDLSYANMKPIPVTVFSSENRSLRIWFDDGTNGIFQLTPDHALTSVPYAFRAAETSSGIPTTRVYTANDTWNRPTGLKYVVVEVVGGGGGSGAKRNNAATGGGGGGGYSKETITAANLGATETVTIGAAGAAGIYNAGIAGDGGAGGTSSFGTHLSATGGGFSGGLSGGESGGGIGGSGSGGDLNRVGQSGEHGHTTSDAGAGSPNNAGGHGGDSPLGFGGRNNNAGIAYGGGASGIYSNGSDSGGASGAAGIVIITEYY